MNSLAMTPQMMSSHIGVGPPLLYHERGYVVRNPTRDLSKMIWKPFAFDVWVYLCLSILTLGIVAGITMAVFNGMRSTCDAFVTSIWSIGMIAVQQSLPDSYFAYRRPYAHKFIIALWILASFVLIASYGAKLISVLLDFNAKTVPFRNIHELAVLLNSGSVYLVDIAGNEGFTQWLGVLERQGDRFQDFVSAARSHPAVQFSTFEDMLLRLVSDKRAVHPGPKIAMRYQFRQFQCNVTIIDSFEESIPTTPFFQHDFPYIEEFSRVILTMGSAFFDDLYNRYIPKLRCDAEYSRDTTLGLEQLETVFYLLFGGASIAAVAWFTELCIKLIRKYILHTKEQ